MFNFHKIEKQYQISVERGICVRGGGGLRLDLPWTVT